MSQDIRSLTSTNLHVRDSHQRPSRRSHNPVCVLVTSTAICQLELQKYIAWRWEPGLLGNVKQPWTAVWSKGNTQFLLSEMERRYQHRSGFRVLSQDSRLPDRRVLGKFPQSQHRPSLITPPRFKVPVHSNPVKSWKFRKADWKRFYLLTGESVERLPSPDTSNIERHNRIFARAYYSQPNNISHVPAWRTMCHAGTKSARPSIAPLSEPQRGLTLMAPPHHYYLYLNRRSRSDERKLVIPSISRTLVVRRGEVSTNILAGFDATLACAPSRQTPSPRNSWRMGNTSLGPASPPGSSTGSCPICWRFQHLRVTISLDGGACCCPQTPEARKVFGIGFHLPGISTPHGAGSLILVLRLPHFLHAPTKTSKDLGKSTNSCDP